MMGEKVNKVVDDDFYLMMEKCPRFLDVFSHNLGYD